MSADPTRLGRLQTWVAEQIAGHTDIKVFDRVTPNIQAPSIGVAPSNTSWGDMGDATVCRDLKQASIRLDVLIFCPVTNLFAAYAWIEQRLEEIVAAAAAAPNLDGKVTRFTVRRWSGPYKVKLDAAEAIAVRVELDPMQIRKEPTP